VLHWIYTTVVEPIITYTAKVGQPRVIFKASRTEFGKLKRLAILDITGAMRIAPIEILLGFHPPHWQLETANGAGI
jgi:hypothetical protein